MRTTRAQSSAARRVRGRPSRVTRSEAPHGPAAPAPGSIETQPPSGSRTEARLRRPSGDHSSALRAEPWRSCSPAGRPAASRRIRVASAATGRMIQCRGGDDVTMAADDVVWRSAVECAALIRRKELSPVELTEAVLARIDAVNPRLNAFALVAHDVARRLAREAEIAVMKGEPLGLLHGVPVSVKDVLFTRGMRTTGGSRLYADLIPEHDAVSVGRLKAAGAVLLGKTTTSEFGFKAVTDSPLFGVTRNPWSLEHTPGGSSGGAAAAVASGCGPVALGTDGGGSVRIPAAFCGVVGVKASYGRVPLGAGFPGWDHVSHVGPLARTVRDAASHASTYEPASRGSDSRSRSSRNSRRSAAT